MTTDYKKQAEDFLSSASATITATWNPDQPRPIWGSSPQYNPCYAVTITTPRGSYSFNFWQSLAVGSAISAIEDELTRRGINPANPSAITRARLANALTDDPTRDILQGFRHAPYHREALAAYLRAVPKDDRTPLIGHVRAYFAPDAYSVLAGLSSSVNVPETFEDFCDAYGCDTDSIRARDTYHAVEREELNLRRIFTSEQLASLQAIN